MNADPQDSHREQRPTERYRPGDKTRHAAPATKTAHRDAQRGRSFQAPSQRAKTTGDARTAAYDVLLGVVEQDSYANLVLPGVLRRRHITGRDAGFTTELVYGALRTQGRLDAIIAQCVDRPLAELDANVLTVVRLGAYQLLEMRVPTHAAVSESVALARHQVGQGASKFVNAVLRKVSAKTADEWREIIVAAAKTADEALAIEHSHPEWIVRAMRDALKGHGRDVSELPELLAADNLAPLVTLVARPGLSTAAELCELGAAPGRWAATAAVLESGDPGALDVVRQGYAGVQDEGSQLVALAAHFASEEWGTHAKQQTWLDLCAGPGGKAAMLGSIAGRDGHTLVAVEVAKHRAELVKQAMEPLRHAGADIKVAAADGREFTQRHVSEYDLVVTDVPCTGLGALRRRPEARWRRQPTDVPALAKLQRELVAAAVLGLKTGGVLAYVTCSPHLYETRLAVADILSAHPELSQLSAPDALRAVSRTKDVDFGAGDDLTAQLWPHIHGTDAMFLALFKKEEA